MHDWQPRRRLSTTETSTNECTKSGSPLLVRLTNDRYSQYRYARSGAAPPNNPKQVGNRLVSLRLFALVRFGEGVLCQADSGSILRLAKETDSPRLRWFLVEMAQL